MKTNSYISEIDTWPKAVHSYILDTYGSIASVEILSGLSRNIVRKVNTASKSVVLKKSIHPAELLFYKDVAPQLDSLDISTPKVEFLFQSSTHYWLILEHIPLPFPRERWNSDDEVLSLLYRLHHSTEISGHEMMFKPAWPDTITDNAMSLLHSKQLSTSSAAQFFTKAQQESANVLADTCWICGDPNPKNLGLRANGQIVLFDWERFGRGTPAVDIAITVLGLGNAASYRRAATKYLANRSIQMDSNEIAHLTHSVCVAKAWVIVDILSKVATNQVEYAPVIDRLLEYLPAWLEEGNKLLA